MISIFSITTQLLGILINIQVNQATQLSFTPSKGVSITGTAQGPWPLFLLHMGVRSDSGLRCRYTGGETSKGGLPCQWDRCAQVGTVPLGAIVWASSPCFDPWYLHGEDLVGCRKSSKEQKGSKNLAPWCKLTLPYFWCCLVFALLAMGFDSFLRLCKPVDSGCSMTSCQRYLRGHRWFQRSFNSLAPLHFYWNF